MESEAQAARGLEPRCQRAGIGRGSGSSANFFPNAMSVPELRFELEQLMREQKIEETVFGLMTQRYEMASVDEARDTSTFQILDHPTLPTYRSRPTAAEEQLDDRRPGRACRCGSVDPDPGPWRRRTT